MKLKSVLSAGLCLALVVITLLSTQVQPVSAFSGSGSGTEEAPYIITDVDQLQEMNDKLDAHYALGNNIDASDTVNWNGGAGFVPIGTMGNPFTGSLDGRGYKISHLFINRSDTKYQGLFGCVDTGGVVENVGLENENVTGQHYTGGLVGYNNFGTVYNCYSTGSVSGSSDVGGLVGFNWDGTVYNCYSTGSVSGSSITGGLVGWNLTGTVYNCYSTGSVSSSSLTIIYTGGLIGYNSNGTVYNCYSTGSVKRGTGGLIGYNSNGTVSNSFWDIETSGRATSSGGTGKTTENMKNVRTYTDVAWSEGLGSAWDLVGNHYDDVENNNIWNMDRDGTINNGCPFLVAIEGIEEPVYNLPPTAPISLVLTDPVKVGETLTATASGSTDPNEDSITCYYKFYNVTDDGVKQDWSTTTTYEIQADDAHDNIIVYTKACDGYDNSGEFEKSIIVQSTSPNTPEDLQPSGRITETDVTLSAFVTDNDGDNLNVFFHDNSNDNLIDNVWVENGSTAEVTWSDLTGGNTYSFYVTAQDINDAWSENSDVQTFTINSLPAPEPYTEPVEEIPGAIIVVAGIGAIVILALILAKQIFLHKVS